MSHPLSSPLSHSCKPPPPSSGLTCADSSPHSIGTHFSVFCPGFSPLGGWGWQHSAHAQAQPRNVGKLASWGHPLINGAQEPADKCPCCPSFRPTILGTSPRQSPQYFSLMLYFPPSLSHSLLLPGMTPQINYQHPFCLRLCFRGPKLRQL